MKPDADSVSVIITCEIVKTLLAMDCSIIENNKGMARDTRSKRTMFLELIKVEATPFE